jgi:hypothetical protein
MSQPLPFVLALLSDSQPRRTFPKFVYLYFKVAFAKTRRISTRFVDNPFKLTSVSPVHSSLTGLHGKRYSECAARPNGRILWLMITQCWDRLMTWIADHFFQDAQNEGWFDAILTQARKHPRAIRTMEYADNCDESGRFHALKPYPSFQEWRKQADLYLPLAD